MKYSSYYTYQKYCNIGGQGMIPVYPNVYSIDADETLQKRLHKANNSCCSDLPAIYRTVSGSPYCDSSYNKCVDTYTEISYDNGETWEFYTSGTTIVEYDSTFCRQFRWVNMNINTDYICDECYDYSKQYLTFVALENGTFNFSGTTSGGVTNTLSYSLDSGSTWTSLANNTNTPTVTAGNTIMWKGNATPVILDGIGTFGSSNKFDVEGNVMSLLYGDNFENKVDISSRTYTFYGLFKSNTNVTNAQELILPATILTGNCYASMFYGCTSLTTAPELSATTLADYCYEEMFYGCTSLSYIKCLATTLENYSTSGWVNGVSSTGTFVKASSMSSWSTGTSGIPSGWTVQNA